MDNHLPEKEERKEDLMEEAEAAPQRAALRPDFSQVS